ncbi:MAG: AAA family ATPase [Erysipelotrichaceae bacterium]|nr:AAA family ATPase [Erysipelotrichaceae bacterium]
MYLKRVELHGFKSFADKTVIEFMPGITGIVGPNGCGKSNIIDAVRWVLGEKSAKAMRGDTMSDVIFSGSEDRRGQNVAEVTLVFDNEDHTLEIDANEVELTRRLYRQGNEAEYLINRQSARLKDITELIMDTGIGRDSLSIISQNNISEFVRSKPEERRGIFEAAAGVSKYKKKKHETVLKLDRTTRNLERVEDLVNELAQQLGPLKRQKEKAEIYLELTGELRTIEISVLVQEINAISKQLNELNKAIKTAEESKVSIEADIILDEQRVEDLRDKMVILDNEINDLQQQLMETMDHVTRLEAQRVEIDANRKFLLENYDKTSTEERIAQARAILKDAIQEYNDRATRYNETKAEKDSLVELNHTQEESINHLRQEVERINIRLSNDRQQYQQLREQIENRSNYSFGVRSILNAANHLPGIKGVLGELITAKEGYEQALATALGGASSYVVTQNDAQAKEAIRYLRNNRAGRATFLPIETMKPRFLREDAAFLVQNMEGYLGIMAEFVRFDAKIESVVLNQIGNIVVVDNLDHAIEIAKNLFHRYRIVTLDGDVINVGGSLTGGRSKNNSTFMGKKELDRLKRQIDDREKDITTKRRQLKRIEDIQRETSQELMQKQMSLVKLEMIASKKRSDYELAKKEYEDLTHESVMAEDIISGQETNQLIDELNEEMKKRDALNEQIQTKRAIRMGYVNDNTDTINELNALRRQSRDIDHELTENKVSKTQLDGQINNALMRLNEAYQMTYEYAATIADPNVEMESAKERVMQLRHDISALGHVNLDAIEDYNTTNERYEKLNKNRLELVEAQDTLLKAIGEMDTVMIERFTKTFNAVNKEFDHVFKYLFGGGHASLQYVDPDDILETGIQINAAPPGKSAKLQAFSGGENALIALSVLFAILRVRPVPMCILDEVEAALDLANVERFARYLREFSDKTQFIVVTHREGTMAECDLLYGATMQDKGVTKLVSVQLKDATGFASE